MEELILTIGNVDLRFTKEGKIQARVSHGGGHITMEKQGFSTTSTSWVDIGAKIGKENNTKSRKILRYLDKNKDFFLKLAEIALKTTTHN